MNDYVSKNLHEFATGLAIGTFLGYKYLKADVTNSKRALLYSAVATFVTDVSEAGVAYLAFENAHIAKALYGDIGNMLGWYIGLNLGKLLSDR